ncbi:disulfide bond formation protein B [Xanthobacteraceae bacterium Astr-EGSB]|uniref:disulfide bond formation protein B n=1 Tax=Astrobacterium formosum TaxID=3069710 RepID=UPI0027AE1AA3|nr:disulfide bond formation protein B [Xanthobacteraceae bacterium Astr-EGSB]
MSDTAKAAAWSRASGSAAALVGGLSASGSAFLVAAGSAAIVAAAHFFQYVLLIAPCPLCLEQRKFHYVAIPLALATGLAALKGAPNRLVAAGLALAAVVLFAGAVLAAYHSGVEWKLWAGPADCTGPIASFGQAGSLLEQMQTTSVVRCDEASWRFLGLSLAGYNGLVSLALAALAGRAAFVEARRRR